MAVVYRGAALWSVFDEATVFGVIHVDELGGADHAIEGIVMLAVWIASSRSWHRERGAGRVPGR
jgi:hypothetical protein